MSVWIYVEGGGDRNHALQRRCREGFSEFFKNAGFEKRMPRIVSCGGRRQAFERFRTAFDVQPVVGTSVLFVDSEGSVSETDPWEHVRLRAGDHWQRPSWARADQLHMMVQTMEAWFYADQAALQAFYGSNFKSAVLSRRADIETIPKEHLVDGLKAATRECSKGEYSKGGHSFEILKKLDPAKVRNASHWCDRLLRLLDQVS